MIVVGRRFVLIRAELKRVDRIQRGGKEEDIYPPSQSCRRIRKTVKKRLEKQPVSGLWIMKFYPHHCDNLGVGELGTGEKCLGRSELV